MYLHSYSTGIKSAWWHKIRHHGLLCCCISQGVTHSHNGLKLNKACTEEINCQCNSQCSFPTTGVSIKSTSSTSYISLYTFFFTLWFVDCSCILRVCNTSVEKITNDYKSWYHIKYPALNNEEGTLFMASVYRGKKLFWATYMFFLHLVCKMPDLLSHLNFYYLIKAFI